MGGENEDKGGYYLIRKLFFIAVDGKKYNDVALSKLSSVVQVGESFLPWIRVIYKVGMGGPFLC